MKQRVKLAQALVHDPDLLLLDEPTNGMDPAGREAMLALIHRIGTEFGISVVVCSHLLGEVERTATHWWPSRPAGCCAPTGSPRSPRPRPCSRWRSTSPPRNWPRRSATSARRCAATGTCCWCRWSPISVRPILQAVADLDLPLHRLDQPRHRVAELFATRKTADV